jgi:non-specific serine/threonine protein kinase/serine/threonine-protein kinase
MSPDAPSNSGLPLGVQEQMNAQCDRFEAAWKAGHRPQLEEFQSLEWELPRRALLRELLLIELTYRYRLNERPVSAEYVARFPMDGDLVHVVFREFQGITSPRPDKTRDDVANAEVGSYLQTPACAPAATVDVPIAEGPGATIGPYKLLERIGEGGFGLVFMAEQQQPVRRKVALKILKPGMDTRQVVARFEAERQALAIMDHPNIAKVHDGGATPSGRPYFVMELVKGVPITEFCDQNQLTPRQRLELFMPVCQAAQHAHHKGIVHRDLKPSNVLVTRHDTTPIVKVIDFGVAKALGQELTDKTLFTGLAQMMGTPLYMSPEQAGMSDLDIDTRSDIYSLGVLLYELLTGTTPFDKRRFRQAAYDEIRRIIREEEPPTPSTRLVDSKESLASISALRQMEPAKLTRLVRGDLDWIVMKALEKDRSRRYETASAFAADIAHYLNDEPVAAGPPSAVYRLRKFVRRNRGAMLATGLIALALVCGMIGTTLGLIRARTAAAAERRAKETAQRRLAQIEKSNEILGSIFVDLNPQSEETEGKPLQALLGERLDQATAQLEGELIGDPLTVARMQMTLGDSQLGLSYPEKAIRLFNKALATFTSELGPDDRETLQSMNNLGLAHQDAFHFDEAIAWFKQTLQRRKALDPDGADTLQSMNNLALGYRVAGNAQAAVPLLEETLARSKATLGPDDWRTLKTMNNLALSYQDTGERDKALPLFEETLMRQKAVRPAGHMDVLQSINNLALCHRSMGHLDAAVRLFEETLVATKAKLGADHSLAIVTMNNLALAYQDAGKLERALPLYEELLRRTTAQHGRSHPDTLRSMNNLAWGYQAAGKLAEALPLYEETLALAQTTFGAEHPNTLITMNQLGRTHLLDGQAAKAEATLRELLAIHERVPDGWRKYDAQSLLGAALLAQQRYSEAEPLLLAGFEGMREREPTIPFAYKHRLLEALEQIARLYETTGDEDKAIEWRQKLAAAKSGK